ncbi:hypothetical protein Tco_0277709 [Tanacetum coccineum]
MQTTEEKVDMSNVLNASLVDTESSGIKSGKHDTSRSSGNDVDADDTYIKPIYDEERMDEIDAQFQKDFSRMDAHCIHLELQLQNNVLKSGQHGQFLKDKSNEAKVKHDIDVIETINIKLEHEVAKLLKENETLKSITKNCLILSRQRELRLEHTTSLIAQNAKFKAQL